MDKQLFRETAERVRVYVGREEIQDPTERNVEIEMLNPIPIRAIIRDELPEKLIWKFPGINVSKSKSLIIEKNKLNLLRLSQKIQIKGEDFVGYKNNDGEFYIKSVGIDYVRIYTIKK